MGGGDVRSIWLTFPLMADGEASMGLLMSPFVNFEPLDVALFSVVLPTIRTGCSFPWFEPPDRQLAELAYKI